MDAMGKEILESNVGEILGCRMNKLLPIVPPREKRAEIKGGHC